ncbi:MAG TPA: hypothetical protein DCY81_05955 [Lachnospiraceae bacterium]|nr:hypothetical protein [Lachnospiraceae bacterium]
MSQSDMRRRCAKHEAEKPVKLHSSFAPDRPTESDDRAKHNGTGAAQSGDTGAVCEAVGSKPVKILKLVNTF